MEFFDKLTKKASETYKGAAEKTGKLAKEAKLKMKISENKTKINEIYKEIGKKVYQKHTSDEVVDIKNDLEEECSQIDILTAEIETYHEEILSLSDIKECVQCKEKLKKDVKFCPKCGAEQPVLEENKALEPEVVINNEETENVVESETPRAEAETQESVENEANKSEATETVLEENKEEINIEKENTSENE